MPSIGRERVGWTLFLGQRKSAVKVLHPYSYNSLIRRQQGMNIGKFVPSLCAFWSEFPCMFENCSLFTIVRNPVNPNLVLKMIRFWKCGNAVILISHPQNRCNFSAICSAMFRQFSDFLRQNLDFALCDLKTQRFFCNVNWAYQFPKKWFWIFYFLPTFFSYFWALDGRNRAIVIAESLARVVVAIRIASVRWRSYLPPPQNTEISPQRPCARCAGIRVARLAFTRLTFVRRGTAEWLARVDRVRWTLAIGDCLGRHICRTKLPPKNC